MSDRHQGWAHRPALDGVRAVAVTAVVLYHLGYHWAQGGFLGVDTFFVLSGYLITSLLLLEWRDTNTVRLLAFWGRRARRLLPAVLLLLGVTALVGALWTSKLELNRLRGDSLSGLFYVANWRFIASGQSYFDLFSAPSPLRHLWSLAIEEQFYAVWPLVVAAALRLAKGASRALAGVCVVGIAGSAIAMAVLYQAADPSRAYYGTDTRVQTILVGALLAIALERRSADGSRFRLGGSIGVAAFAGTIACFVLVPERLWFLYHGGSLLFACLVVPVIIMADAGNGGAVTTLLTLPPVRWLGRVSYGVYLWHWPMIVWLTSARVGVSGIPLDTVRVAAAVAAAAVSFYVVERPIRRASFATLPRRFAAIATAAVVALALVGATAGAQAQPSYYGSGDTASAECKPTAAEYRTVDGAMRATGRPLASASLRGHRILLIGDSTACSLYPAMRELAASAGASVANGTVVGCGVVADHYSVITLRTYHCHALATQVEQVAYAESRPDLVVWSSAWERMPIQVGSQLVPPTSPRWRPELLRRMADVVHRFAAGGAHVVILTQPPFNLGVDPSTGKPTPDAIAFLRLNGLLREFAADHPSEVTVLDMADLVCPSSRCIQTVGGAALRSDGAHFSPRGSVWLTRWLLPRLVTQR